MDLKFAMILILIAMWLYFGFVGFFVINKNTSKCEGFKDWVAFFLILILVVFGPLLMQTAYQWREENKD